MNTRSEATCHDRDGSLSELGIGLSLGNCDGSRRPETVTGRLHPCGSAASGCRRRKGYADVPAVPAVVQVATMRVAL